MPWKPLKTLRGRRVGDKYDVQCSRLHWWHATVVEIAGDHADARIKVSYDGWAKKYDEWITAAAKVRKPRGSDELVLETAAATGKPTKGSLVHDNELLYKVKALIKKKVRGKHVKFMVQWDEYEGEKDEFTWEPKQNIEQSLIDAFETAEQERAAAKKKKQTKKAAKPLLPPHTVATCGHESTETKETFARMAALMEDVVGRAASKHIGQQSDASTKPRLLVETACDEEHYYGLHMRMRAIATEQLELEGEPENHVTKITAVDGSTGRPKVVDQFKVVTPDVIDAIITPFPSPHVQSGALVMRNGSLPVALLAPLTFKFHTTRGVAKPKRLLRVYGNTGVLRVQPEICWELPTLTPDTYRFAHKVAMATAIRRLATESPGAVEAELLEWLNSPAGQLLV